MTTRPSFSTAAVVVVVPAHNEEERIGACVEALGRAAAHPRLDAVAIRLVVVADACDDATAWRAAGALTLVGPHLDLTTSVVTVSVRNVGLARAFGAAHAFRLLGPVDQETVWLATTDADSVVPEDWLAHHLDLRQHGAEGCAGMVVVDSWRDHQPATQEVFERRYWPRGRLDFEHSHVHGTNLGVSMAAYLEAGGFPGVVTGEDHALWRALAGANRRLVATPIAPVTTSGRRQGRSPAGFADLLASLLSLPA
jgi:glycosyltransferase involved in cell wall biosynthesis